MKTPITYYGGKQMMLPEILPIIPKHRLYCEPFFGGGAVFWAKEPSKCEVINDVNMNVVNFYEVLKHGYFELKKLIEATLHSRDTYKRALLIYEMPELFADFPALRAGRSTYVPTKDLPQRSVRGDMTRSVRHSRCRIRLMRFPLTFPSG